MGFFGVLSETDAIKLRKKRVQSSNKRWWVKRLVGKKVGGVKTLVGLGSRKILVGFLD